MKRILPFFMLAISYLLFVVPVAQARGDCVCGPGVPGCNQTFPGLLDEDACRSSCSSIPSCTAYTFTETPEAESDPPEEAGTAVPSDTQCCVSGEGCQSPIAGASGPRCLNGSPDPSPCTSITTCTTVQNLQPSPSAASGTPLQLPNPLGTANVPIIVGRIIKVLSGGAGMIALLMFVYGGFQWLTSGGNAEKIKKGQAIILWSLIGLVVMFSSYIATRYIIETLVPAATR